MKKNTFQHTPTPWKVQKYEEGNNLISEIYGDNISIAKCQSKMVWGIDGEEYHRNAEFIVKAVNSYEENKTKMLEAADCIETLQKRNDILLELLKDAVFIVESGSKASPVNAEYCRMLVGKISELITQAERKVS